MNPGPATRRCAVHRLGLVDYQEAWALQRRLGAACRERGEQQLLLLEHPPTYTLGARGKQEHLLLADDALARLGATVQRVDRGGDITFHGPGQLVGYPILDLASWNQGPLWYVRALEAVLIETLSSFAIDADRLPGRPGVWVGQEKIASIGVHVSRGITSHGFALNVDPDLSYFSHIVPCGLPGVSMTSMAKVLRERPPSPLDPLSLDDRGRGVAPAGVREGRPPRTIKGAASLSHSENSEESGPSRASPHSPAIEDVRDAVVRSFADVFEIELLDGDRVVAPAGWTSAVAL